MAISFVLFEEYPGVMGSISDLVEKAIKKLENPGAKGCCFLAVVGCGAVAALSQFGVILSAIDQKIGELGIVKVAEFVAQIVEVFCKFFHINLSDTNKIGKIFFFLNTLSFCEYLTTF